MSQHSSFVTFALKISGLGLDEINPVDIASLLGSLCRLIGADNLQFDAIRPGSAYVQVRTEEDYYQDKLEKANQAILLENGPYKEIQKVVQKYKQASAEFIVKKPDDKDFTAIHQFKEKEAAFVFSQHETIRGQVVHLWEGRDDTDHIHIQTDDGKHVKIAATPDLSQFFGSKWRTPHLIEVSGQAKYKYISFDEIILIEFRAEQVTPLPMESVRAWLDSFVDAGESGWSQFDDPVAHWLRERHE